MSKTIKIEGCPIKELNGEWEIENGNPLELKLKRPAVIEHKLFMEAYDEWKEKYDKEFRGYFSKYVMKGIKEEGLSFNNMEDLGELIAYATEAFDDEESDE
jgi:hypothetical protein